MEKLLGDAHRCFVAGNFGQSLVLHRTILAKFTDMPQSVEHCVMVAMASCHKNLYEFVSAVPFAERSVILARAIYGQNSCEHAAVLRVHCEVLRNLGEYQKANERAFAKGLIYFAIRNMDHY
jgi:hypothetical protein